MKFYDKIEACTIYISSGGKEVYIPFSFVRNITLRQSLKEIGVGFTMSFKDVSNVVDRLPIKEGDALSLSVIDAGNNDVSLEFTIIDVTPLQTSVNVNDKSQVILNAISTDAYNLLIEKVSNGYDDEKTIMDVIKDVIGDIDIEIDNITNSVHNFAGANQTKYSFIKRLCEYASNGSSDTFLFYEDFNGIKIKSIDTILDNKDNVDEFLFFNQNERYKFNVLDYKIVGRENVVDTSITNVNNIKKVGFDIENKKVVTHTVKVTDDEIRMMGSGSVQRSYKKDRTEDIVYVSYNNKETFESSLKQDIYMSSFSRKIDVLVNGDFSRNVGDIIFLQFDDNLDKSDINKQITGFWLVESLALEFHSEDFKMKIRLTSNGTIDDDLDINNNVI